DAEQIGNRQLAIGNVPGGEGGIRTHGTVSRSQHFQCCQFNHSCTSPEKLPISNCQLPIELSDRSDPTKIGNRQSAIFVAERVGFEPTVEFPPLRFSR